MNIHRELIPSYLLMEDISLERIWRRIEFVNDKVDNGNGFSNTYLYYQNEIMNDE